MSPPLEFEDRMSPSDALLWNLEADPVLRSTIASLMLLDQAPDDERFAASIDTCIRKIPRLRERALADPLGIAPPRWIEDPDFDLDYHVRRTRAPGDGTIRALLDWAAPVAMQGFDKDRPLWELHLVDGLEGGRTALLMKLHHAISDGVGMVRMTKHLVERSREEDLSKSSPGPELAPAPELPSLFENLGDAVTHRAGVAAGRVRGIASALSSGAAQLFRAPRETTDEARETAGSIARFFETADEPLSPILVGRSTRVRFDRMELPLEDLKRAGKAAGGTLNDAFIAAIGGGLARYHEQHGRPVDKLRMTMPINIREGEAGRRAGNQFAPARFPVEVAIKDPRERMRAVGKAVASERAEPALGFSEQISAVLAQIPPTAATALFGAMLKSIDFVTSNVPGPRFPVFMSGAKVEHMVGFGPLSGAALNVTLFSYDGKLGIGITSDRVAVTDPELLLECLNKGIEEVCALA